jgi:molecular chaperone DnaK
MKQSAQEHAAEDKKRKESVETRNQADSLVFQTKKQIEEMKDKITSEQKNRLESEIVKVEDALKTNDIDKIKSSTEGLTKVWNEIAQQLYQQQGPGGPQAGQPGGGAGEQQQQQSQQQTSQDQKKDDREVQDASYEVVDDK